MKNMYNVFLSKQGYALYSTLCNLFVFLIYLEHVIRYSSTLQFFFLSAHIIFLVKPQLSEICFPVLGHMSYCCTCSQFFLSTWQNPDAYWIHLSTSLVLIAMRLHRLQETVHPCWLVSLYIHNHNLLLILCAGWQLYHISNALLIFSPYIFFFFTLSFLFWDLPSGLLSFVLLIAVFSVAESVEAIWKHFRTPSPSH